MAVIHPFPASVVVPWHGCGSTRTQPCPVSMAQAWASLWRTVQNWSMGLASPPW